MEKINVAELLKDCPEGMELDCTMYDDVFFYEITDDPVFPIRIKRIDGSPFTLTKYGEYANCPSAKCVIFPKGKTTWEGFHRPFEDGDILVYKHKSDNVKYTFIYKRRIDMHYLLQYCGWFSEKPYLSEQFNAKERKPLYENDDIKFATEEEKQKLFKAIKDNGYKWNAETKTLEKLIEPGFKVGNRIKLKGGDEFGIITEVADCFYTIKCKNNTHCWPIKKQDDWELVPDKFDINTLKPFDKVLVRMDDKHVWSIQFFERLNTILKDSFVCMGGGRYHQCIPYEGNEHLLNKVVDCDEFFKTWE